MRDVHHVSTQCLEAWDEPWRNLLSGAREAFNSAEKQKAAPCLLETYSTGAGVTFKILTQWMGYGKDSSSLPELAWEQRYYRRDTEVFYVYSNMCGIFVPVRATT